LTSTQLAERLAKLAWEKKGQNIEVLDVRGLTDVTDYYLVVSGESELHVKAITDFLQDQVSKSGEARLWHKEGYQKLNWVVLDYIDVVVHIFQQQKREFYALEKLWGDARIIRLEEDVPDKFVLEEQN